MIPVKYAIESGAWLKAEVLSTSPHPNGFDDGDMIKFQIRLTGFLKLDLFSVDDPENLQKITTDSNVWALTFDLINLCSREVSSSALVSWRLLLVDDEGFEFNYLEDDHLTLMSNFSEETGLRRFYHVGIPPKIKKQGIVCFDLPEFFEDLSISVRNGKIIEI